MVFMVSGDDTDNMCKATTEVKPADVVNWYKKVGFDIKVSKVRPIQQTTFLACRYTWVTVNKAEMFYPVPTYGRFLPRITMTQSKAYLGGSTDDKNLFVASLITAALDVVQPDTRLVKLFKNLLAKKKLEVVNKETLLANRPEFFGALPYLYQTAASEDDESPLIEPGDSTKELEDRYGVDDAKALFLALDEWEAQDNPTALLAIPKGVIAADN
jgi:hypothetical protein